MCEYECQLSTHISLIAQKCEYLIWVTFSRSLLWSEDEDGDAIDVCISERLIHAAILLNIWWGLNIHSKLCIDERIIIWELHPQSLDVGWRDCAARRDERVNGVLCCHTYISRCAAVTLVWEISGKEIIDSLVGNEVVMRDDEFSINQNENLRINCETEENDLNLKLHLIQI